MIWICYFINHHFELLDHKGSSAEEKSVATEQMRDGERLCVFVCMCVCVCVCVCLGACIHLCPCMYECGHTC